MTTLTETWADVWAVLHRAITETGNPARYVSLATLNGDAPALRLVALRHADAEAASVNVHTDRLSLKVPQLLANANVALLAWDPAALVQLRLTGTARLSTGNSDDWAKVPDPSREAYGHQPPPGSPIPASNAWDIVPDPNRLGILRIRLTHVDHVSLDPNGHRRAGFARADDWRGQWLSP